MAFSRAPGVGKSNRQALRALRCRADRPALAMGGQIIDATVVPAPKQRNTKPRRSRSRKGAYLKIGKQRRLGKRIVMLVCRSSTARPRSGRLPMPRRPKSLVGRSTLPFRCSATKIMSASTAAAIRLLRGRQTARAGVNAPEVGAHLQDHHRWLGG